MPDPWPDERIAWIKSEVGHWQHEEERDKAILALIDQFQQDRARLARAREAWSDERIETAKGLVYAFDSGFQAHYRIDSPEQYAAHELYRADVYALIDQLKTLLASTTPPG